MTLGRPCLFTAALCLASSAWSSTIFAQVANDAPQASGDPSANEALPAQKVSRLDVNSDGYISRDEASPALISLFPQLDTDRDDRLDARELRALREMVEKVQAAEAAGEQLPPFFASRDINGDNSISPEEAGPGLKRTFKRFDSDNNGLLDAGELRAIQAGSRSRSGDGRLPQTGTRSAASSSGEASSREQSLTPYWVQRDKNSDNVISHDEAGPALKKEFQTYDLDGNGVLDGTELRALGAATRGRRSDDGDRLPRRRAAPSGGAASAPSLQSSRTIQPITTSQAGAEIVQQVQQMTDKEGLDGAAVIIVRKGPQGDWTDVVRTYTGSYRPDTMVAIASTTKWFTAATVGTVVDEGKIAWDQPISQCIDKFPTDKKSITLRQTLSHISGLPALSPTIEAGFADLAASAENILRKPLIGRPGTRMRYSGTAYQVAARCAEVGSGKDFRILFSERIAQPLKLTQTIFGGTDTAPATGGGMGSSPADLETFTRMIAGRGEANGVRVLSEAVMRDMTRFATSAIDQSELPNFASRFAGMGTGVWCERVNDQGECSVVSSIGAFGTYAWVDYERGEYGVFFVRTALRTVMPYVKTIRDTLQSSPASGGV